MKEPAQTRQQLERKIYALERKLENLDRSFIDGEYDLLILLKAGMAIRIIRLRNYIKKLKVDLDKLDQLTLFI